MRTISEFEIIARYFKRAQEQASKKPQVHLGIGDDCALLAPAAGKVLAISTDMLVEGKHFLPTTPVAHLGYKALAVNLSDLAAMGAKPLAFTLSVALPSPDEEWCEQFAKGLFSLADQHQIALIGGDTTAGPLCISITIFGESDPAQTLKRSGANVGDDIYVSHPLQEGIGAARFAYEALCGRAKITGEAFHTAMQRMEQPTPRVELGVALQGVATSAIDTSDGLLGDLNHILTSSLLGARIEADTIPRSSVLQHQPVELQRLCTLAGGDDYELIFTAPMSKRAKVLTAAHQSGVGVTIIGRTEEQTGIRLYDARNQHVPHIYQSFDHFKK